IVEDRGLVHEAAEQPVCQAEGELEAPCAEVAMHDLHLAGVQQARDRDAPAGDLQKIAGRPESERPLLDADPQGHADAAADILLEARRAAEALGRVDRLRKASGASVDPQTALAAEAGVLGDEDPRPPRRAVRQRAQAPAGRTPPPGRVAPWVSGSGEPIARERKDNPRPATDS